MCVTGARHARAAGAVLARGASQHGGSPGGGHFLTGFSVDFTDLTASACSVIAGCVHHICLPDDSGSHTCLQQAECNSPVPMLGNYAIMCP